MNNDLVYGNESRQSMQSYGGHGGLFTTSIGSVAIGALFFYGMYRICRDACESVVKTHDAEFNSLNKKVEKRLDNIEKEMRRWRP